MFSGSPLLAAEVTATDSMAQAGHLRSILGKKPGRGFCHKETKLYISDSGTFKNKCKILVMIRTCYTIILSLLMIMWLQTVGGALT